MTSDVRIGLISDTHGLLRPAALDALRGSDRIVHAGDIGDAAILDELARIAPVTAVRGNNDLGAWADTLREVEVLAIGGVRIGVIHDVNEITAALRDSGLQAIVSGHSHRPRCEEAGGVLYVNPGSAGPRRFTLPVTVGDPDPVARAPRGEHREPPDLAPACLAQRPPCYRGATPSLPQAALARQNAQAQRHPEATSTSSSSARKTRRRSSRSRCTRTTARSSARIGDDAGRVKSNVLLIGSSGTGKTLMCETLSRLLDVPFVTAEATFARQHAFRERGDRGDADAPGRQGGRRRRQGRDRHRVHRRDRQAQDRRAAERRAARASRCSIRCSRSWKARR